MAVTDRPGAAKDARPDDGAPRQAEGPTPHQPLRALSHHPGLPAWSTSCPVSSCRQGRMDLAPLHPLLGEPTPQS